VPACAVTGGAVPDLASPGVPGWGGEVRNGGASVPEGESAGRRREPPRVERTVVARRVAVLCTACADNMRIPRGMRHIAQLSRNTEQDGAHGATGRVSVDQRGLPGRRQSQCGPSSSLSLSDSQSPLHPGRPSGPSQAIGFVGAISG
jgi:hypothetical protein